jgi:hypothetical protein
MNELPVIVVGVAFAIGLVAAVFAIVEWVALLRFSTWAFRIGPRVMLEGKVLPRLPKGLDASLDTQHGEFRRTARETVLFRPRSRGLSVLDAFAIGGTLRWSEEETVIDGRIPVGPALFVGCWLVGWGTIALMMWRAHANLLIVLGLASVVPLVVIVLVYLVIPMEVRRARRILDEFAETLEAGSSRRSRRAGATER